MSSRIRRGWAPKGLNFKTLQNNSNIYFFEVFPANWSLLLIQHLQHGTTNTTTNVSFSATTIRSKRRLSPSTYLVLLLTSPFQSIHPRLERSATISSHLRSLFESGRNFKAGSKELLKLGRDADNMVVYLKSHRLHKVSFLFSFAISPSLTDRLEPTRNW